MVCAAPLCRICVCWIGIFEAGYFEWISEICGSEAVTEDFGECAATAGRGEVVMDIGFAGGWEEEEPVLFHW